MSQRRSKDWVNFPVETLASHLEASDPPLSREQEALRSGVVEDIAEVWRSLPPQGPFKVVVLGSSSLGVASGGDDLDLLCIENATYDGSSTGRLCSFADAAAKSSLITHVVFIGSRVPIVRLALRGISIDLQYEPCFRNEGNERHDLLPINKSIPMHDHDYSPGIAAYLTTRSLHCFAEQYPVFRGLLRAVRYWARRRGVYGASFGLLGGVHIALLAAFAVRQNPCPTVEAQLVRFFALFGREWDFGNQIDFHRERHGGEEEVSTRSPHLLRILSPVPPFPNTAYSISRFSFDVLREEFRLGAERCDVIVPFADVIGDPEGPWASLFRESSFFIRYDYYLRLTSTCPQDMFAQWKGFYESRLVKLISLLEISSDPIFLGACFFPRAYGDSSETDSVTLVEGAVTRPTVVVQGDASGHFLEQVAEKSSEGDTATGLCGDPGLHKKLTLTHFCGLDVAAAGQKFFVGHLIKLFIETYLSSWNGDLPGAVGYDVFAWKHLPDVVFPEGRDAAWKARTSLRAKHGKTTRG